MSQANSLEEIIKKTINKNGPLTVADYMNICLNHERYGYYKTQKIFGGFGDFITAPEICQIFGELLAIWLLAAWQQQNSPKNFILCEAGPGRGTLMYDILRTIKKLKPEMLACAKIILIETSPKLIQQQNTKLFEFSASGVNINWQADINKLKAEPLFLVANEFLDALPIQQYIYTSAKFYQRRISIDNDNHLIFIQDKAPSLLQQVEQKLATYYYNLPDCSIIEKSPSREKFIATIAQHIAAFGGIALVIDYGEIVPAHGDTLQAVKEHQYVSVFKTPGEADITSQVDFYSLAHTAKRHGCASYVTSQGEFLLSLGAEQRIFKLTQQQTLAKTLGLKNALNRLISPKHMGRLFKVLALSPEPNLPPIFTLEQKL